tara:strand:+ start:570 stop:1214 length:645 start_codon:yes stop_codon:yes gene_type:complete
MIEKGMRHDEIIELILEELKNDFDVYANVSGWSHYRGSRVSCKADLLLYDPVNGFLFGVEVKTFYSFNCEWMKKAFEQMVGYNNAGFKIPNLNRPLHPHGFFLASPRTNERELLADPQLMKHLELLPGGLGVLRIGETLSLPGNMPTEKNLQLTSGETIWNNHIGYHPSVHELLCPQVGSKKMVHEAVGVKLEGDQYRRNASVSSQNRCQQDFR